MPEESEVARWHRLSGLPDNVTEDGETIHAAPGARLQAEKDSLRAAIASLRERGETVVCVLPGHESELDEFQCDRELVSAGSTWAIQPL